MARTRCDSDEAYVLDLCDAILLCAGKRQHRFPFLVGDPGRNGRPRPLPVDAYYEPLRLVVEYRERQHSEAVPIFDRRPTVSGVPRGEQRALYDQRRRTVLPAHGLMLVEVSYSELAHDRRRRLLRLHSSDVLALRDRFERALDVRLPPPSGECARA